MALSAEQIAQLARLSRLSLDEDATTRLRGDLQRMMDLAATVSEVDTAAVTGTAHVHAGAQPLRDDTSITPVRNHATDAQDNRDGLVIVPQVIG